MGRRRRQKASATTRNGRMDGGTHLLIHLRHVPVLSVHRRRSSPRRRMSRAITVIIILPSFLPSFPSSCRHPHWNLRRREVLSSSVPPSSQARLSVSRLVCLWLAGKALRRVMSCQGTSGRRGEEGEGENMYRLLLHGERVVVRLRPGDAGVEGLHFVRAHGAQFALFSQEIRDAPPREWRMVRNT